VLLLIVKCATKVKLVGHAPLAGVAVTTIVTGGVPVLAAGPVGMGDAGVAVIAGLRKTGTAGRRGCRVAGLLARSPSPGAVPA
jgi:hypothetical protein